MSSKQQLIKEVATEIRWTQADVQRALDQYGNVSTKEEIYSCCLRFAGPELKKRKYEIGALKKVSNSHKDTINMLVEQLTSVEDFFQNELVPTLRATIDAQAIYIQDILKQMPWASKG